MNSLSLKEHPPFGCVRNENKNRPVSPSCSFLCSFRDAVDLLNGLYNQVDEEVHKLVILSNKSQKELESLLEVRRFEEQTQQVSSFTLYCSVSAFLDTNRQSALLRSNSGSAARERSSSYRWSPKLCLWQKLKK